jgi:hypothetical protein
LDAAAWRSLARYVTRWAHRAPVVAAWHGLVAATSASCLDGLRADHNAAANGSTRPRTRRCTPDGAPRRQCSSSSSSGC